MLFFIELSARRVQVAEVSAVANVCGMSQIARNLTDSVDGLLTGKSYVGLRGGSLTDSTPAFFSVLRNLCVNSGPDHEPQPERPRGEIRAQPKESCLERLILVGESSLRTAIQNFVVHYHHSERNH